MNKLENAKQFLSMGIAVIPLRHRGKEPESAMMGGTWERYKAQLPTEYDLIRWLGSGWQNYGVVMGWNNLAVIDFDNADVFEIWQGYFKMIRRVYDQPYIVRSARGAHVYITLPGEYQNSKRVGVDIKVHGYVAGPGSVHPSGVTYTPEATEYQFPEVYDLDTLLPPELFPPVTPSESQSVVNPLPVVFTGQTEYDPFEAAGRANSMDLVSVVKASVRIEDVFPDRIKTSADGRWWAAKCPFHDDKRPSFWIDTRLQLCGCQVCGMKPMDAINLYARMNHMSESNAVSAMAEKCGVWG